MKIVGIEQILNSKSLRSILESKDLAHLGDFLVNFIYTSVRIGYLKVSGSIHVWDICLRTAMELANLRNVLGKKTKPDKVADAAEALVAYAYFTELMGLDEMVELLAQYMQIDHIKSKIREKEACTEAFSKLFIKIIELASRDKRFNQLNQSL